MRGLKIMMLYFTVREWISECIRKTENGIDSLYKYYASDINVALIFAKSEDAKQPNCPEEKERAIVDKLKHFGMM